MIVINEVVNLCTVTLCVGDSVDRSLLAWLGVVAFDGDTVFVNVEIVGGVAVNGECAGEGFAVKCGGKGNVAYTKRFVGGGVGSVAMVGGVADLACWGVDGERAAALGVGVVVLVFELNGDCGGVDAVAGDGGLASGDSACLDGCLCWFCGVVAACDDQQCQGRDGESQTSRWRGWLGVLRLFCVAVLHSGILQTFCGKHKISYRRLVFLSSRLRIRGWLGLSGC